MERVQRWIESHTPSYPWSDTRWQSKSPAVRPTALDRTYEHLDEHEREIRETLSRLDAELQVLRGLYDPVPPGSQGSPGSPGSPGSQAPPEEPERRAG